MLESIIDFLEPVHMAALSNDEGFKDTQLGKHVQVYEDILPDIDHADLVIVGCNEMRGMGIQHDKQEGANEVRKEFYSLFYWHTEVTVADLGNIKTGATLNDSYAAVRLVVSELIQAGKKF